DYTSNTEHSCGYRSRTAGCGTSRCRILLQREPSACLVDRDRDSLLDDGSPTTLLAGRIDARSVWVPPLLMANSVSNTGPMQLRRQSKSRRVRADGSELGPMRDHILSSAARLFRDNG